MKMDAGELTAFGTRYAKAWCSQNPDQVASFFAERGSLTVNDGPAAIGREAIAQVARGFMEAFPDLVVVMDDLVTAGDLTTFHWTLFGTNTGPGGTGRRVRISGAEQWQLTPNGLIGSSDGRFDAADYARQLSGGG